MISVSSAETNMISRNLPKKKKSIVTGIMNTNAMPRPFLYPLFTLSTLPAPMFWATKEETPFPRVISVVMTMLFSLIAAA